uniref:Minor glycoprotein n=1 Tax=Kibale red colobus virus 2 TaxID=1936072 RepID=X2D6T6_9NIDO|nr:minor glycoprotein [Kibale red colobus virus 2]
MGPPLLYYTVPCICFLYLFHPCSANTNTSNQTSQAFCFLLPAVSTNNFSLQLTALYCNQEGDITLEFDQDRKGEDACEEYTFKPKGSTNSHWGGFLHKLTTTFNLSLEAHPSHVFVGILLSYTLTFYPEVFNFTTDHKRAFNITQNGTDWRFCVNQTTTLPVTNRSLESTLMSEFGPGWDVYTLELLRPFLLSLLLIGIAEM